MSADWNPGDLAKCIRDDWKVNHPMNPRLGEEFMVSDVRLSNYTYYNVLDGSRSKCLLLSFVGRGDNGWYAACFVKVQPRGRDRTVPEWVDRHVKA